MTGTTVFMPSHKRREGDGGVGTQIDFAGWQVWWRGIEFDVWQARVSPRSRPDPSSPILTQNLQVVL